MQMLPIEVQKAVQAPGQIDQMIKKYFQAAKYSIDNDKTLAGTAFFHWKDVAGVSQLDYFTGTYDNQATNMPGQSFIRPQSEHQLIYGLRVESAVTPNAGDNSDWQPGSIDAWGKNLIMTITSNSVVMVKDYPISEALENLTVRDNGVIPFAIPFIWGGQEEIKITIKNTLGNDGAANTFYKLTLIGVGLV